MWRTNSKVSDDNGSESALRAEAHNACGVLLRDVYGWFFDKAFSPASWKAVPSWAERIPSEVAFAMMQLEAVPSDAMLETVERSIDKSCGMLGLLQDPPDTRRVKATFAAYVKFRRADA